MSSPPLTENNQPPADAAATALGPRRPYLTFLCAGERYAAPILKIREILSVGSVTRVPATPAWIRGVMNLRGRVLPVVDLAAKLDLPPTEITSRSCIVMTEVDLLAEQIVMGMIVDAVDTVIELAPEEIEPPPAFGTRMNPSYLLGMARTEKDELALVLDTDRVLSVDELLTAATLEGTSEENLDTEAPAGETSETSETSELLDDTAGDSP